MFLNIILKDFSLFLDLFLAYNNIEFQGYTLALIRCLEIIVPMTKMISLHLFPISITFL